MLKIETSFIKNKAIELAEDEDYYEKVYISFIFQFIRKFNKFCKTNQKIIEAWINNDNKKANKMKFLYKFIKTIIFLSNKPVIDYSLINTFVEFKNEKQKREAVDTLIEMENELKGTLNNILNSDEFRNLNFLAQAMLGFIKSKDDRIEMIYFNLKQLEIKKEVEELENLYLDLTKMSNEKFTNSIKDRI